MEYRIVHGSGPEVMDELNKLIVDYRFTVEHYHIHEDKEHLFITLIIILDRR